MNNIITKADYINGTNSNLVKGFVDDRSPRQIIEDNFEKGLIDQQTHDIALQVLDKVDLSKGGEGSKGGKVIGHTQSGKPIYSHKNASEYGDFTKQDHWDAQEKHNQIRNTYKEGSKSYHHHNDKQVSHLNTYLKRGKSSKERLNDRGISRDITR